MNSKKNSCRGNYMRKYGILDLCLRWVSVVRVITNFKVEAALAKNSLTNNIFRIPGIVRSCLSKFDDDRSIQTIAKKLC